MNAQSLSVLLELVSLNNIVIDILKLKNIQHVTIQHCEKDYDNLVMHKVLNQAKISLTGGSYDELRNFPLKFGMIIDAGCEDWDTVFSINNNTLKSPNSWIVTTANFTSTVNKLSQYPIEIDSDVIVIVKNRNSSDYELYSVFNTGFNTNGSFIVENVGHFESKLNINLKYRLQISMKGVILKCPIVIIDKVVDESFLHFLDNLRAPHVDPVHKFKFYRVLRYLEDMYHFQYDFQRTSSWGYLRNGTFDGMVGAFQRHQADVGGSGVFFRTDRAKYVDYVVEIWKTRPCFVFRHPKYPGGAYTVFTRPLSLSVWYCLVAALCLAGVLLCCLLRVKSRMFGGDSSASLIFIFIASAIGQQGIPIHSKSTSTKIILFSTLILSLTIYQHYTAIVVSTLLREPAPTIRSLEDLVRSKMEVGVEDSLYDRDYFKRTTDPIALRLYRKKIVTYTKNNFFTPERGMALVKQGGFAFHLDSLTGYRIMRKTFTEREICDVLEIQLYPPQHTGVVLKRGSPYKEHFAVGIRKMYECGVMSRLRTSWDEPRPLCVRTPDSSAVSVTLRDFSPALVILGIGVVLAGLVLAGEVVWFRVAYRYIPFTN